MARSKTTTKPATKTSFAIEESLQYGWKQTQKHFLPFWGFMLIAMVLRGGAGAFTGDEGAIAGLVGVVVGLVVSLATTKFTARLGRGEGVVWSDFWEHLNRLVDFTLVAVLYGLAVMIGFLLLILPGIYLAIKYMFAPYLVVDKGMAAMDALKASAKMTDGVMLKLFFFCLVAAILNIGGLLLLGIGLLLTIPITVIAQGLIYNRLAGRVK